MPRICVAIALMLAAAGAASAEGPETAPATQLHKLPFTISKETTVIVSPLKADGTPDYVAALNDKYGKGATPENNGFLLYLRMTGVEAVYPDESTRKEILSRLGAADMPKGAGSWVRFSDFLKGWKGQAEDDESLTKAARAPWEEKDHSAVAAFLKARHDELDSMARAASMPRWWRPDVSRDGSMLGVGLPSDSVIREMGSALCARAMLRFKTRDFDGFLGDLMTAKELGRKVASGEMLLEWSAGEAIDERASDALGAVIGSGELNARQCMATREALARIPAMSAAAERVDVAERWQLLDEIVTMSKSKANQLFAIDDGVGVHAMNTIEQQFVDYDVVLRLANKEFDATAQVLREPEWADEKAKDEALSQEMRSWAEERKKKNGGMMWIDAGEDKGAYSRRIGKAIVCLLLMSTDSLEVLQVRRAQKEQMLIALLAAAESKAEAGKWPGSLEELVPAKLVAVPADHFVKGATVKYLLAGDGIRIYSLGQNGMDDGGVLSRDEGKDDIAVGVAGG